MHDQLQETRVIEAMPMVGEIPLEILQGVSLFRKGKVRDVFELNGGELAFVATDRLSAFDQVLGEVPGKGQVNTLLSKWWFEETADIIPNHMVAVIDPNVMIGRKLERIPVEVVVRGYMTGVTDTSIWGSYAQGEREIYGLTFRDGYNKNDPLDEPIITPTTKADVGHDERLTEEDTMVGKVIGVTRNEWETIRTAALTMFARAQGIAAKRGYILVDTKMEFGRDARGRLYVIDELFTPDSSRYWLSDTYAARHGRGEEPDNYDKEFLRIALKSLQKNGSWEPGKPIPRELTVECARRYMHLYETLTGEDVAVPVGSISRRIRGNVDRWIEARAREEIEQMPWGVIILMGSPSDRDHVQKITDALDLFRIPHRSRVASVHKTLDHLTRVLGAYALSRRQLVFITVAGGLDALSGTVDGALPYPVISAPPEGQSDTIYQANLHTPKGIAPLYTLKPENAAVAAAKILAVSRPDVRETVHRHQEAARRRVIGADGA